MESKELLFVQWSLKIAQRNPWANWVELLVVVKNKNFYSGFLSPDAVMLSQSVGAAFFLSWLVFLGFPRQPLQVIFRTHLIIGCRIGKSSIFVSFLLDWYPTIPVLVATPHYWLDISMSWHTIRSHHPVGSLLGVICCGGTGFLRFRWLHFGQVLSRCRCFFFFFFFCLLWCWLCDVTEVSYHMF